MKNLARGLVLAPSHSRHSIDARRCARLRLPRKTPTVKSGWWSVRERLLFVERLADADAVDVAARSVGRTRSSAFAERARDPLFARAWDDALDPRVVRLETLLLDRTLARLEPVLPAEKLNEAALRHDSTLGMWFLENLMPSRYGKVRPPAAATGVAAAQDRPAKRPANAAEDDARVGLLIESAAKRIEEAEALVFAGSANRR